MFLVMHEKLFVKCLADVFFRTTICNFPRVLLIMVRIVRKRTNVAYSTSLQKGNRLTTETTEITETKDRFIFCAK